MKLKDVVKFLSDGQKKRLSRLKPKSKTSKNIISLYACFLSDTPRSNIANYCVRYSFCYGSNVYHCSSFETGEQGVTLPDFEKICTGACEYFGLAVKNTNFICAFSQNELSTLNLYTFDTFSVYPSGTGYFFTYNNIHIMDLTAYFQGQTFGKIAKMFDLEIPEKLALEINLGNCDDKQTVTHCEFIACSTLQIYTALNEKTERDYGFSVCEAKTPASLASKIFRTHYLDCEISSSYFVRKQAMRSSWGGSNVAYARGDFEGDITMYDAVSMYPSACIALEFLPLSDSWRRATLKNIGAARGGIMRVKFKFNPDELYPCLPVYAVGRLVFPLEGVSDCTLEELKLALELGCEISELEGFIYDTGTRSVANYMRDMLEKKTNATSEAERHYYKMLLNTLTGKFSQKRLEIEKNIMLEAARDVAMRVHDLYLLVNWKNEVNEYREKNNLEPLNLEEQVHLGTSFCPEWFALITGYARAVQARAVMATDALTGSTDSVTTLKNLGDGFKVLGVKYKKVCSSESIRIFRARLYIMHNQKETVYDALHGAPKNEGTVKLLLEKPLSQKSLSTRVTRAVNFWQGVCLGKYAGVRLAQTVRINTAWDDKRILTRTYSKPHRSVQ